MLLHTIPCTQMVCLNTVHERADPGSWQIAAPVAGDFANIFLYARAKIANAVGKPWILEETGMEVRALTVLRKMQ